MADSEKVKRRKIKNFYTLERKKLGSGAFSNVVLGKSIETDEPVAIKVVKKALICTEPDLLERLEREIDMMQALKHPHVVNLIDFFVGKNYIFLVMELCKGGDLNDYLNERGRPMSETQARHFFKQLLSAVTNMHENGICHRDIKVENLLLDESHSHMKITDLGLANYILTPTSVLTTPCGTLVGMAPEMITSKQYGLEVDIWSMGTVLYAILSLTYPFMHENEGVMIDLIVAGNLQFEEVDEIWSLVGTNCKDLIRRMLCVDPKSRITLSEIAEHPWVKFEPKLKNLKRKLTSVGKELSRSRATIDDFDDFPGDIFE